MRQKCRLLLHLVWIPTPQIVSSEQKLTIPKVRCLFGLGSPLFGRRFGIFKQSRCGHVILADLGSDFSGVLLDENGAARLGRQGACESFGLIAELVGF